MFDRVKRLNRETKILAASVIFVLLIGFFVYYRVIAIPQLYRETQFLLDTVIEITVASARQQDAHNAIATAFEEIRRIEELLSRYRTESQVAIINQHAGENQAVRVDQEVVAIIRRSVEYASLTNRVFDITIGPVIDLWGIGTDHERVPDDRELQQILRVVDYRNIEIQGDQEIRLPDAAMKIDLGGIAKGYSIDRAIAVLQQYGITSALVNAGGDLRCLGTKPDGTPWRVGVQHPRSSAEILGVIEVQDAAVATSGDYERFFMLNNVRYHHIFDPATGKPVRDCQSVTIVTDTTERADVFATAVFILGPQQGLELIEARPELEGMIVRSDGTMVFSSGFSLQPTK